MRFVSSIILLLAYQLLLASPPGGLEAMDRGDYAEAVEILETEVVNSPSAAAYYNLGLAYFERGELGLAAWAALSSRALGGVQGLETLSTAIRRATPADLRPLSAPVVVEQWRAVATSGPDNLWAGLAVFLGLAGGALIAANLLRRAGGRRSGLFFGLGTLCWMATMCVAGLAVTREQLRRGREAAVVTATAVYAAPSEQSELVQSVPAGVTLSLGERLGDTYAVELPTGESGWVPAAAIRRAGRGAE